MAENTENWTKLESDSRYPRKYQFEELENEFNQFEPITSFNYKGTLGTYTELPTTGNSVNDAYGVLEDGLVYIWNGTSFPAVNNGFDFRIKPTGVVEDGNASAVSGNEVYQRISDYVGVLQEVSIDLSATSGVFTSSGNPSLSNNWISTNLLEVVPGNKMRIEGFMNNPNKRIRFFTPEDTNHQTPILITIPSNVSEFEFIVPEGVDSCTINVASGTNVGADIPNSPYNDSFKVFIGHKKINTERIVDRIESEQILALENTVSNNVVSLYGNGAPPYMYGIDNVEYLDISTGRLYKKINGKWDNGTTPETFELEFEYPVDFTWQPAPIYKQKNGKYCLKGYENITTLIQDDIISGTPCYIDPINGDNSNDGLTLETARKGIQNALTNGFRFLVLRGGLYELNESFSDYTDNTAEPLIIVPYKNERVVCGAFVSGTDLSWTADDNIFYASRTNVSQVFDASVEDSKKGYFYYEEVSSIEDCKLTEKSFYRTSSLVYVNTGEVNSPESHIKINLAVSRGRFIINSNVPYYYIEGINSYHVSGSGGLGLYMNSTTQYDTTVYLKNCKSYKNSSGNSFSFERLKLVVNQNCYGYWPLRDALNYHTSTAGFDKMKFIEINGSSLDTGKGHTSESSSNGSTAHDGIVGMRFGGDFNYARGGVVIDVNANTYTLNFAVQSKYTTLVNGITASFQANNNSKMKLYGCVAIGSRALTVNDNGVMTYDAETIVRGVITGNVVEE